MLATFEPGELEPISPGIFFPETDRATYRDVWRSAGSRDVSMIASVMGVGIFLRIRDG